MLRRAAVLGATAHVASNRGQAKAEAPAAEQAPPPQAEAPQAPPEVPAPTSEDSYDALVKLKELLDAGVLTQAEFDEQKQKILSA
jgi:hypothetical protein